MQEAYVLLLIAVCLMTFTARNAADTCVMQGTCGQQHRHYFYHLDQALPIILENSNRASQQFANHILKIVLENVLCYGQVELLHRSYYDNINATAALDRITGCMPDRCARTSMDSVPETMVNLEVWMEAGFDKAPWVDTKRLIDAGPLGPYGRMGWFMPTSCVEEMWSRGVVIDHWRALLNQSVARNLSWWGSSEWRNICPSCETSAFRSNRCNRSRKNCATLFSSFKDFDAGMVQQQVERLDLPVDIVWLEGNLNQFVLNQTQAGQCMLFLSWVPSKLILSGNFSRMSFPELLASSSKQVHRSTSEFQVNQFSKIVWYHLKAAAPDAFHVISKMSLSQQTYYDLLDVIRDEPALHLNHIACQWMQHNRIVWEKWLPPTFAEKPKIYLAGFFPLSGHWTQPGLVEGAKLAIDFVNADNDTLPSYELALIVNDTQCQADVAMNNFIKLMLMQDHSFKIAGILGPACSDDAEPIAALTRHFHTVMVSYGAEAASLSDRGKYPYFFRTIPQVNHLRFVYADFFKEMGWTRVGALAEGGQELPEYHLQLQEFLQEQGISVLIKHKVPQDSNNYDLSQVFRDLRNHNIRIIIGDFYGHMARAAMCEAYRQSMTAHQGYVWFLPSWYTSDWWDTDFYNSPPSLSDPRPQESVPCTTQEMELAIEGHFIVSKAFTDDDHLIVQGGITVAEYKSLYADRVGKAFVEDSPFASFVYDAVWVFAKGLQKLLSDNPASLDTLREEKTARALVSAINNTHFQGVSGYIQFNGSDRMGDVLIQQFFQNETLSIGQYQPNGDAGGGGFISIDKNKIRWLSPFTAGQDFINSVGQSCTVEDFRLLLGVECQTAIIIANVMGFVAFIIITIICLIFIKCRYDAKVRATHERMKELGLLSKDHSHYLTLDEWEIPRKNLVLNRRLGEGAFGTVCGGELLTDKEGWVAVAVKTLKIRHSMEEKLDFFSEVGMMKHFKHPNIVPLMGVCTRNEPVCAIMEFQLHGDLKTYLLSRRNLVGQSTKEAEDVNAQNLTKIAADIASGLQYLHRLKYVHRDLACRNCLVHANKTVKISDFGMTRHVSDTDYYRFTRKGMLPVRWMSPESLADGIFTFKSDIWSFGVVVYEIVTFGSFPYQGLSNTQVLEYVKQGNRLTLPDKCPEDLRSFIYWCMFYDQGFRPDLEDIIDYLEYNQQFLVPCLDAPMSSVVMEDTDSLEMKLPSGQTNLIHNSAPPGFHLSRRSGSWQDKLASAARKTFSVPGFSGRSCTSKPHTRTYLLAPPTSDHVRSNSVCAIQSGGAMDSLVSYDDGYLRRSSSCHKQLSLVDTGDRVGDASSDYFSDTSKEVCQPVTSV